METNPKPGNVLPRGVEDCQCAVGSSHKLRCNAPKPAYNYQLCSFDEQVPGELHHQLHPKVQILSI